MKIGQEQIHQQWRCLFAILLKSEIVQTWSDTALEKVRITGFDGRWKPKPIKTKGGNPHAAW